VRYRGRSIKKPGAVFWIHLPRAESWSRWTIYETFSLSKLFLPNECSGGVLCYGRVYSSSSRTACFDYLRGAPALPSYSVTCWALSLLRTFGLRFLPAQRLHGFVPSSRWCRDPEVSRSACRKQDAFQANPLHRYPGCFPHAQPRIFPAPRIGLQSASSWCSSAGQ